MGQPIRVLHLEDNRRDATLISDLLQSAGVSCDIVCVDNGQAFERTLNEDTFDIILSDNNLPDYSGTEALQAVRRRRPAVPVIIISGTIGEYEAVKCLQDGATDYLLKERLERLAPAVRRALAEARDRERREAAEAELRANEERMRLALTATNDAIWDWDLKQGRMVCNETFTRLFGVVTGEQDPRTWWYERTHPEDRDAIKAGIEAAIKAGSEFWAGSHRLQRPDGTWARVRNRACLARDDSGAVSRLIGAVQDVTSAVASENERRQLEEQLRQAQKLEAIGTLAGGIAHDFNNILGIILANAELAQIDLEPQLSRTPEAAESLREIQVAAERARDLVRQILTFSRRTDSEQKLIQIGPIVRECVRLLRSTIPPMVKIADQVDSSCPSVLADPTQVHQVVMNICTNAWHALPDRDGRIEVSVSVCKPGADVLEANPDLSDGRYVRISIADNGKGMDAKTKARIFEPFFTTKSSGQGTGLGLAVVHGIVKAHGGAIEVRSEPGAGTTFHVYLPAQDHAEADEEMPPPSLRRGAGQRILIVDDEAAMGRALQRHLKRLGYLAQVFHRPELALEVLRDGPHDCDLVLTDFLMPTMSGIEFAGRVLQLRPDMPIILLSGAMDSEDEKWAHLTAFKAMLKKPISPHILSETIAETLAAQSPDSF